MSIKSAYQDIAQITDRDKLIRQFTSTLLQETHSDFCAVMLCIKENSWRVEATSTHKNIDIKSVPLEKVANLPHKFIQSLAKDPQISILNDLGNDLSVTDQYLLKEKAQSLICLPISDKAQLIGLVYLSHHSQHFSFTESDILGFQLLCHQVITSLYSDYLQRRSPIDKNIQTSKSTEDLTIPNQAQQDIQQQFTKEKLLRKVSQMMGQSLDLQTIFDSACHEIRHFMKADRVAIFKFEKDSDCKEGKFIAESKADLIDSVIEKAVEDHCFEDNYESYYFQGRYFAVNDIYTHNLEDCHVDILERFQVRAKLIVPLIFQETLWGLLCLHECSKPRQWDELEIDLVQQLGNHLGILIHRSSLFEQLNREVSQLREAEKIINQQAERERLSREISQRISQYLDLQTIFDTACDEIRRFIKSDRACIFKFDMASNYDDGEFVSESVDKEFDSVLEKRLHDHTFGESYAERYFKGKYMAIGDIHTPELSQCHIESLEQFQIRANLVIPLSLKDRLWGLLCVHQCSTTRHWEQLELDLVHQLANELAIAIQQAELFEQLHQELTERQKAQKELSKKNEQLAISNLELIRATRMKDEFLANMSHELRTPLNTILGMMQALDEQVFGPLNADQRKAIQTTERNGRHLLELINDILDLAKVESGTLELDCNPTNVVHLCQFSLTVIAQQAQQKDIQLESKLPYTLPEIVLDERRLRQVLINLLNNAVKFTSPGGKISLEVVHKKQQLTLNSVGTPPADTLQFIITDTGIGIQPHFIPKLFQPFIQIDSALNRQYAGTGLGLALVKRIVELHGGTVSVTSTVGQGSSFVVELPYQNKENNQDHPPSKKPDNVLPIPTEALQKDHPCSTILLVEDNPDNVLVINSYLSAKGYKIIVANNGEDGIIAALNYAPDFILMDIQMPGIDGFETIEKMRSHSELLEVPIVALTALAMKGDRERCLAAGANNYLGKPIDLRQLIMTIEDFLKTTGD